MLRLEPKPAGERTTRWSDDPALRVALVVLALLALVAVLAPIVAPYDPLAQPDIIRLRAAPPSPAHPFGTDSFSRDVLSRVIYGARVSLGVGFLATIISVTAGTAYGLLAGYSGGVLDGVLMRVLDGCLAIPRVLLVLALAGAAGSLPLWGLVVVLGFTGWFTVARLVRAEARVIASQDYVSAARALGASGWRIATRHILPNVIAPVAVAATLGIGHVMAIEAGLSYLGLGVQPPTASWGSIIHDGTEVLRSAWWIAMFPGLALFLTVLVVNAIAERLRIVFGRQEIPIR